MSRPYIPGVWAQVYEQLPHNRKNAVIAEVNELFAEQTGVTRKLDPDRDMHWVRIWLRLRDDVMSGRQRGGPQMFLQLDGIDGSSKDPRHRGWMRLVRFGAQERRDNHKDFVVSLSSVESSDDIQKIMAQSSAGFIGSGIIHITMAHEGISVLSMNNILVSAREQIGIEVKFVLSPAETTETLVEF